MNIYDMSTNLKQLHTSEKEKIMFMDLIRTLHTNNVDACMKSCETIDCTREKPCCDKENEWKDKIHKSINPGLNSIGICTNTRKMTSQEEKHDYLKSVFFLINMENKKRAPFAAHALSILKWLDNMRIAGGNRQSAEYHSFALDIANALYLAIEHQSMESKFPSKIEFETYLHPIVQLEKDIKNYEETFEYRAYTSYENGANVIYDLNCIIKEIERSKNTVKDKPLTTIERLYCHVRLSIIKAVYKNRRERLSLTLQHRELIPLIKNKEIIQQFTNLYDKAPEKTVSFEQYKFKLEQYFDAHLGLIRHMVYDKNDEKIYSDTEKQSQIKELINKQKLIINMVLLSLEYQNDTCVNYHPEFLIPAAYLVLNKDIMNRKISSETQISGANKHRMSAYLSKYQQGKFPNTVADSISDYLFYAISMYADKIEMENFVCDIENLISDIVIKLTESKNITLIHIVMKKMHGYYEKYKAEIDKEEIIKQLLLDTSCPS